MASGAAYPLRVTRWGSLGRGSTRPAAVENASAQSDNPGMSHARDDGPRLPIGRGLFDTDVDSRDGVHIVEARDRRPQGLTRRDRAVTLTSVAGLIAAVAAMAALAPVDRSPSALVVAALLAAYMIASRVEFEVGPGSAVPTQLVLVPMLFLLPPPVVPGAVAGALVLAHLNEYLAGRIHPERASVLMTGAWHAVGPALVIGLAGDPGPSWKHWPLFLGALGAQFAFDLASAAARDRIVFGIGIREQLAPMASVWAVDLCLAPIGLVLAQSSMPDGLGFLVAAPLVGLLAVFARERRRRLDSAVELSHAYRGTALLLGDVVEADDAYTGAHSREVVDLVVGVSRRLELDLATSRHAELTALLHDVGKIRVPKEIINKPGPLTPAERAVIELHTVYGEEMLRAVGGTLAEIGALVRSCHERWDGAGYPDRLAGEAIPLVARIVCACDAFSAMTADRPYRAALTPAQALTELLACAGTQFDPRVVEAIVAVTAAPGGGNVFPLPVPPMPIRAAESPRQSA